MLGASRRSNRPATTPSPTARQGEGELVGTGLEVSMDVESAGELVKKTAASWPRLETETHFMVLGIVDPNFTVVAKVRKSRLPRR